VDLISLVYRPYLFRVTVTGQPPHPYRREYRIQAESDDSAAITGMRLFAQEFMPRAIRDEVVTLTGKAKLQ
jgi:hypothetical protein